LVGNGDTLPVTHWASTSIPTVRSPLYLNNVLVSPSLVKNLILVRSLTHDNNISIEFDPFGFSVKDLPTRTVILRCDSTGDLYPLATSMPEALTATAPSVMLWHQRLGHPGRNTLRQSVCNLEFSSTKQPVSTCEACQLGKHVRLPFTSSTSVSYVPFQIVHADVWTSPTPSFSGFKYYLVLIDDFSHYVWTFPLRSKSDVLQCLLHFHAYITTQFQLPLIAFQTDNGKEFDNHTFRTHLASSGVALRLSCPYTSSQNGKAKRILQTLNDCVRSLLIHAGMPDAF
jgi:histone deacetylase 1/2